MSDFTIEIRDWLAFGNKIRDWATGQSSTPLTIGEFRGKVGPNIAVLGSGFENEDPITIFQAPPKTQLSLVIPHPDDLNDVIPSPYPLPPFYQIAFGTEPDVGDPEEFRSKRIADYVMRKCV